VTAELRDISGLFKQAKEEKFDLLILDCPPYQTEEVLEVSRLAGRMLLADFYVAD
jgi:Mrp family chromosome partitioning ATPase